MKTKYGKDYMWGCLESDEIPNERPVIWIYEIVDNETGEIVKIISRKFESELSVSLRNFHIFNCVGYFGHDSIYHDF